MENKNTGLKVLVVILSLLVLGSCGYIVYDKVLVSDGNNDNNGDLNSDAIRNDDSISNNCYDEDEKITYNYDNIIGLYKSTNQIEIEGKKENATISLYLWANGIFKYECTTRYAPAGVVGNYIIKNNKIILNDLFITGSDVSLRVTSGIKEIEINENTTLIDTNYKCFDNESISITLKKDISSNEDIYKDENYLYNMMNGYHIMNATNSNH